VRADGVDVNDGEGVAATVLLDGPTITRLPPPTRAALGWRLVYTVEVEARGRATPGTRIGEAERGTA
jgi:hypothetical protein